MNPLTITPATHALTDIEIAGRALHDLHLAAAREVLAEAIEGDDLAEIMRAAV